jgi:hypothetical protein
LATPGASEPDAAPEQRHRCGEKWRHPEEEQALEHAVRPDIALHFFLGPGFDRVLGDNLIGLSRRTSRVSLGASVGLDERRHYDRLGIKAHGVVHEMPGVAALRGSSTFSGSFSMSRRLISRPFEVMSRSKAQIAHWGEAHPGHRIVRWSCRWADASERDA